MLMEMDENQDGSLSREEWHDFCKNNEEAKRIMNGFLPESIKDFRTLIEKDIEFIIILGIFKGVDVKTKDLRLVDPRLNTGHIAFSFTHGEHWLGFGPHVHWYEMIGAWKKLIKRDSFSGELSDDTNLMNKWVPEHQRHGVGELKKWPVKLDMNQFFHVIDSIRQITKEEVKYCLPKSGEGFRPNEFNCLTILNFCGLDTGYDIPKTDRHFGYIWRLIEEMNKN